MVLYLIRLRSISASLLRFRGSALRKATSSTARRPKTAPTYEERLSALKSAEKRIAVIAVGSMVVGYIALKMAFSGLAPKQSPQKKEAESNSGTRTRQRRPLVVAGPSGSGKSSLLKLLFKEYPNDFGFSISHTTRKPREGEVDGREYHFTTREEMKKSIDAGDFIEWAEFSGNMYGTSVKAVQDVQATGKVCVLDIDMQGVRSMKKTDLNPIYIFIKPPSMEVLEKRLKGRKTESDESLQRRLNTACEEMEYAENPGVFDYVVVNDDLDEAYQTLKTSITQNIEISGEQSTPK